MFLTISEFADRDIDQCFMFIFDIFKLFMMRILTLMMLMKFNDDDNFDTYKVMMKFNDDDNFDSSCLLLSDLGHDF